VPVVSPRVRRPHAARRARRAGQLSRARGHGRRRGRRGVRQGCRYLGLGYPGGPEIDRLALSGDAASIRFPRASTTGAFDFSFSGLKTAVVSYVRAHPEATNADVAASFQEAVVDVLVAKFCRGGHRDRARGACLAGE